MEAPAPGSNQRDVDNEQGVRRARGDDPADRRAVVFDDLEAGARIVRVVACGLPAKLLPHQQRANRSVEIGQFLARRAGAAKKLEAELAVSLALGPAADDVFLFGLFRGSRPPGEDLSFLDAPLREQLMRQQFRGQGASYRARYPDARFEIVERDGAPIGRIVTARTQDAALIVDIALIASWRRRGIGASLVNGVLIEARAAGLPVRLTVFANNALAQRFYLRLGFKPIECSGIGIRLEWREPCQPEAKA